jgi:hypothetical protein
MGWVGCGEWRKWWDQSWVTPLRTPPHPTGPIRLEFLRPHRSTAAIERVVSAVRAKVPFLDKDMFMTPMMEVRALPAARRPPAGSWRAAVPWRLPLTSHFHPHFPKSSAALWPGRPATLGPLPPSRCGL